MAKKAADFDKKQHAGREISGRREREFIVSKQPVDAKRFTRREANTAIRSLKSDTAKRR
jgi:hypothetical protein